MASNVVRVVCIIASFLEASSELGCECWRTGAVALIAGTRVAVSVYVARITSGTSLEPCADLVDTTLEGLLRTEEGVDGKGTTIRIYVTGSVHEVVGELFVGETSSLSEVGDVTVGTDVLCGVSDVGGHVNTSAGSECLCID